MQILLKLPGTRLADWNDFLENHDIIPNNRVKSYFLAGTIFVVNELRTTPNVLMDE
jgi:hypothetical protein